VNTTWASMLCRVHVGYLPTNKVVGISVDQRPELEGWLLVALLAADANRSRPS
jgi:hypothetical protein